MIHVSQDQLDQVEYLIQQSIQGNHILFDAETVRQIFHSPTLTNCSPEESYSVEHHIERVILQPTLEQKRAYLEQLDSDTLKLVVKTYFNIVENNLFEHLGVKH